jgi:hypothetical protein
MDNNSHNDESLLDFTTEFDSALLNPHQKVAFDSAFSLKRELLKSMESWKREKKNPELKVPEVNIMARAGLLSRPVHRGSKFSRQSDDLAGYKRLWSGS